ncbi:FMN-dependent NADH-azoreductase [Streptomyces alfalfae]|uniref:FMN-dependent NADH-azoreductase n=1 Tax=Streptomyces alfalfae TaxID=1642299 RepID=A0ABM6GYD9_9ACTN|nr:NAD(P)H-binding protein [Streptomyces alfalfae]AYA19241.1 NAD-dependent epimerase/dehydratase family protein [Streptomyces fradiae]APY88826.1 FMN-dependent NADH-azoreductase [Streptomyces alfalfae]QUI31229.1 NmrA family NAD(P)-binding protein [Streptomyces alfalfae]RXX36066.1 FMN-dependent NADH-azoreductase [Streptomyces alfalfae]RZN00364.1 NAD-dependent epimerase/dehydratase family protein [Streptomyces alfalfae]
MIVVTGATGNVGRALVDRLGAEGAPVRALTRDPRRARLHPAATVARLDLADEHTAPDDLTTALKGATRLFLHLRAAGDHTAALLRAAAEAGVTHVTVLSSGIIQEGADTSHPIHVMHAELEAHVRHSGLDHTLLRPNAFATNSLQWAPQTHVGDTVRGPFAQAATAPIHEADIAEVAARTLLDDTHRGAVHRLTGPHALTTEQQIHAIGTALGRPLRFIDVPPEDIGPETFPHVPPQMLPALLASFAETVGVEPEITTTVETVTGRPARTFDQWAHDHRDDFRKP